MKTLVTLLVSLLIPAAATAQLVVNPYRFGGGPPPPLTRWVTGTPGAATRNDDPGTFGTTFIVGAVPITVKALGLFIPAAMTTTHRLGLWNAAGTLLGEVTVPTGGTANTWLEIPLGSPVTLTAGHQYYLGVETFAGGDLWYDFENLAVTGVMAVHALSNLDGSYGRGGDGGANYIYAAVTIYY